jgi:regulator of protease activity HflC (stomatin/prohibitin superfamily)
MKTMSSLVESQIQDLAKRRQWNAVRRLASQYPDDPKAQQFLRDIDLLSAPTKAEKNAVSMVKYLAYAALVLLVVMIGIVAFTVYSLR